MPSLLWCQDEDVYDVKLIRRSPTSVEAKALVAMGYEPMYSAQANLQVRRHVHCHTLSAYQQPPPHPPPPPTCQGELNGELKDPAKHKIEASDDKQSRTLYTLRCKAVKAGLKQKADVALRDAMAQFLLPVSDIALVEIPNKVTPDAEKEAMVMRLRDRQYELLEPWRPELATTAMLGNPSSYSATGIRKAWLDMKGLFNQQHRDQADLNVGRDADKPMVLVFIQRGGARCVGCGVCVWGGGEVGRDADSSS